MSPSEIDGYLAEIRRRGCGSFIELKMLEDGTVVGTGNLMFTTALYVDLDLAEWGNRYCFDDRAKCFEQYGLMDTGDFEPTGYIASR